MSEVPLEFGRGRNSGTDSKRVPKGFVDLARNFVYSHEDPDRIHKIPGRTLAGSTAETGVTTANSDGIAFARYDQSTSQLVMQANDALYEADAGTTLGSWTKISAFSRSGSFVKSCQDSLKRNIFWSGASGERPLVRDVDGNWRYLSMLKPGAPTITLQGNVGSPASASTIDSTVDGRTTVVGTQTASITGSLYPAANSADGDRDSYGRGTLTAEGVLSIDYSWAALGSDARTINILLSTSSLPEQAEDGSVTVPEGLEPLDAKVIVQVDTTDTAAFGAGTTVYNANAPIEKSLISLELAEMDTDVIDVRIILHNKSTSLGSVHLYVYDVWLQPTDTGSDTAVTAGTYSYAITEVYRVSLSNGKTIYVESAPSDLAKDTATKGNKYVTTDGSSHYGVTVNLPPQVNSLTKSASDGVLLYRRIYRTTSTGSWPNLGKVADVDINTTTYEDVFSPVSGTQLGSPGLQVLYVGDATYPISGVAPAFRDATNYRGSIVAIPEDDPHSIVWSPPGFPDYFPFPHNFSFLTEARGDEGKGITSVGDTLLLFLRNAVYRIRNLAMATGGPEFNPVNQMRLTEISPSEGLAGGPLSYCKFHTQRGHTVVAWISDSGIWMTDGSLPSERGMGTVLLTTHLNWDADVDTTRLDEARLTFDPVVQTVYFDYYDRDGNAQTLYLHTSPRQWTNTGEDQMVPVISGPHSLTSDGRVVGDDGTNILHWTLDKTNLRVLNERTGTDNVGSAITSALRTHWTYLTGARRGFQIYAGEVYHSDWGASEVCNVEIQTRRDASGITQSSHKKGISLAGDRLTPLVFLQGSGQSLRAIIQHTGNTTSIGTPTRALGPVVIEAEPVDEIRKD